MGDSIYAIIIKINQICNDNNTAAIPVTSINGQEGDAPPVDVNFTRKQVRYVDPGAYPSDPSGGIVTATHTVHSKSYTRNKNVFTQNFRPRQRAKMDQKATRKRSYTHTPSLNKTRSYQKRDIPTTSKIVIDHNRETTRRGANTSAW